MSLSTLPLSYCTNVHPGLSVDDVILGLKTHTFSARKKLGWKIGAGLWLAAPVIDEIQRDPAGIQRLRDTLAEGDLTCFTLNTFPYGNFHSARVKENVYLPDWTTAERRDYTVACAKVLTELMPVGVEGSLSTVPLGFKPFQHPAGFSAACIDQLLAVAEAFDQIHDETGQVVRLAIEPEPYCELETTAEAVEFFRHLYSIAEDRHQLEIAQRHLGICYDVCHQAVEYEDQSTSISQIASAGIRINKVHLTCAIHVDRPADNIEARTQLANFVEQRYLHQTFARSQTGAITHISDLTTEICSQPTGEFALAESWRVHFHVPVHQEEFGKLSTTRSDLKEAIAAVAKLEYAPHLEVETYTWGVLPEHSYETLADGIANELQATQDLLSAQK
ncbi:metabolite traffic protein EboE [Planctomicrobium sp. SH668]|uniref:metabolite traffic protein EboE n=1 Tax=Planctomicrobium sp. SH668 TaxID=3448126 RepID=UPI003F5C7641